MKPMLRVRQRASSDSVMRETSDSPIQTSPSLGLSRPAMRFNSVVLPEPLGPMRPKNSPSGTSRLRLLRTSICSLPRVKNLCTPRTRTIGLPAMGTPTCFLLVISRPLDHYSTEMILRAPNDRRVLPAFLMLRLDQFLVDFAIEERDDGAHVGAEILAFLLAGDAEDDDPDRHGALGAVGLGHQPGHVALVKLVRKSLGPNLAILEL